MNGERHPRGLTVLFLTEMWERFSFYLMLGILYQYLSDSQKGGMGWSDEMAAVVVGSYIGLVYFTPFIGGLVECVSTTGYVGMADELAGALADFRECNYERIYLRPASVSQGQAAIAVLRALVEHFIDRPNLLPGARGADLVAGSTEAARVAVTYVGGMTDRFAFRSAVALLGWDPAKLPESLGVA